MSLNVFTHTHTHTWDMIDKDNCLGCVRSLFLCSNSVWTSSSTAFLFALEFTSIYENNEFKLTSFYEQYIDSRHNGFAQNQWFLKRDMIWACAFQVIFKLQQQVIKINWVNIDHFKNASTISGNIRLIYLVYFSKKKLPMYNIMCVQPD